MFIKVMSWILEMLNTWRTIRPQQVISVGTDSYVHTVFRFANISGVCTKAMLQINYPTAFACNKVSNTKCFWHDGTLKIC